MKTKIRQHLNEIQIVMRLNHLWEEMSPPADALANDQPFCIGTLSPTQWLQWIFIPRMNALLEANADLPHNFAISPYIEEALKNEDYLAKLCLPLSKIEILLSDKS